MKSHILKATMALITLLLLQGCLTGVTTNGKNVDILTPAKAHFFQTAYFYVPSYGQIAHQTVRFTGYFEAPGSNIDIICKGRVIASTVVQSNNFYQTNFHIPTTCLNYSSSNIVFAYISMKSRELNLFLPILTKTNVQCLAGGKTIENCLAGDIRMKNSPTTSPNGLSAHSTTMQTLTIHQMH